MFEKPEAVVSSASKVPGTDGQKMSKTYRNIIPIFDADPTWKNAVSRIVTDGKDYTKEPLTVENETVFALYSLMASQDEVAQMLDDYVNNRSFGYGHAKQRLLKKIEDTFGEANRKFGLYKRNQDDLDSILTKGAEKARIKARATLELVRETVGLNHAIK